MVVLVILFVLFCLIGFTLLGLVWLFRRLDNGWSNWSWTKRLCIVGAGAVVIACPYLTFKVWELNFILARVPDPLHASWIEYRVETASGIGMPGDNETGFVVYRLTRDSARWARTRAARLEELLPGGSRNWQPTPVADWSDGGSRWHPYDDDHPTPAHAPDIKEFLGKYGFEISIEPARADEFNRAIQASGSFYSYGPGGSVTIVDPRRGKVYFAYAG